MLSLNVLILSYFDQIVGPQIFLKAPEVLPDDEMNNIPLLMDFYEKGFFIHISGNLKSLNQIFVVPSNYSRGKQETLLISIIIDINSEIHPDLAQELLEGFVEEFTKINKVYKAFYLNSERYDGDPNVYEEVKNLFYSFFKSFQPTVRALKIAENRYQSLFKAARDAILIVDKETAKILDANEQAEKLLARPINEIIGIEVSQIHFSEEFEDIRRQILKLTKVDHAPPVEVRIKKSDGTSVPTEINASEIKIGKKQLILTIFRDITERKRAEQKIIESEKKLRKRVKELSCLFGISKIVEKSHISYDNIIQSTLELIPPAFQFPNITCARIRIDGKEYKTNNFKETDWKIATHIEVNEKLLDIEAYYLEKNQFLEGEIFLLYDIANRLKIILERKEAEEKLRESEQNYRDAYDKANFYKELFALDMNNILSNIKSSIELLSLIFKDPKIIGDKDETLQTINAQITRGLNLILYVQKLSNIDDICVEKIEVNKVLNESIKFLRDNFKERLVEINVDAIEDSLFVKANDLLLDAFENILINAAQHNNKPFVAIQIKISKEIKDHTEYIKIEFLDNAMGIPDSVKEKVFQKEFKKDKKFIGRGLGLYLVKKIINGCKGFIWIEDKIKGNYKKGSNFIVLIPEAKLI